MAGALCGHVRRHPSERSLRRTVRLVFAMYAISHEVSRRTEPWWELDFEVLGQADGRVDQLVPGGKAEPGRRFYFPTTGRDTGTSASHGTPSETRPQLVGGRRDDRAVGDGRHLRRTLVDGVFFSLGG
jgi:hypothetical protein